MSVSFTHHTVAISQVVQITQGARQRGLDVDAILRRAGISPELQDSSLSRVTQAQYAALIVGLRRVTRDELWGLLSQPLRVGSFAQACRVLVHCATLGEALRTGLQFYHLMLADFVPRMAVAQATTDVHMVTRGPSTLHATYAERAFMFLGYGLMCWLVARRIPLLEVTYAPLEGDYGSDTWRLFQVPIRFDGRHTGMCFDSRWLDLPVVQNRQSLQEFLQQAPASLLVRYRDPSNMTERIRRLLRRRLDGESPSLDQVSESLAMTPQTLRRRLREEGQGFQAIKDDLRRDAAIEYLAQPDLTLLDIANHLGFSDASTFHRAFKGWTGLSPGIYRQTHCMPGA